MQREAPLCRNCGHAARWHSPLNEQVFCVECAGTPANVRAEICRAYQPIELPVARVIKG